MDTYKIIDEFISPAYKNIPFEVRLDKNIYDATGKKAEIAGQVFNLYTVMGAHRHDLVGLFPHVANQSLIGKTMYVYNPEEKNSAV